MPAISRVIVGVSGSPDCLPALRYAAAVARAHDVPLIPVLAWHPYGERSRPAYAPFVWAAWADAASAQLRAVLEVAFGGLPPGVHTEPVVMHGEPGRMLVGAANRSDDLLIIGAGRQFRLGRGRVSRYCLAHAACPVLAVPSATLGRGTGWRWLHGWSLRHGTLSAADIVGPAGGEAGAGS